MDRRQRTARVVHEVTNSAFWLGNEAFMPDYPPMRLARFAMKAAGINLYATLRNLFFDKKVIAINGESVVVTGEVPNTIDKHMFRRPHYMSLEQLRGDVEREIKLMQHYLSGIALATTVAIKPAHCFRPRRLNGMPAVTQTQPKLNLEHHAALNLMDLAIPQSGKPRLSDALVRNLEALLVGSKLLMEEQGMLPDISGHSGNLRIAPDGTLTLIDVMPLYTGGGRLIGDTVSDPLPHTQRKLARIETLIGRYGAD